MASEGVGTDYEFVIIGAGVVGTAIARTLSLTDRKVLLVDAALDVGSETSKANTAILHTGFDAKPGTLESRLVRRGYDLLGDYAHHAGIAAERLGALLVAWDEEQLAALPGLAEKAAKNGYTETRVVPVDELRRREPNLGPGALGALEVPGESIIDPWTPSVAFATEAVTNGVKLELGRRVVAVEPGPDSTELRFDTGPAVTTRWTVNAAGLGSDLVDRMFGHDRFTIVPRRGQLIVFDKLARPLVHHILLPVPTAMGKGVLISPTVFGNVMLGPTAENLEDRGAKQTTALGMESLLDKGSRLLPALLAEEVTATYAGLRAATEHDDYQLHFEPGQRYVCVGGIRSTGLTSALAIGEYVLEALEAEGVRLPQVRASEPPRMSPLGEEQVRPYEDAELIAADPEYGRIACHCERVSRGELRDAVGSPVPPRTPDGLRRRTRAMNGRCQGFFCSAGIAAEFPLPAARS